MALISNMVTADFSNKDYPKLFVAGEGDKPYANGIKRGYEYAAEPKELVIYDTKVHGTAIFRTSKYGEAFVQLLLTFLDTASSAAEADR
jgi:hypothetical protein